MQGRHASPRFQRETGFQTFQFHKRLLQSVNDAHKACFTPGSSVLHPCSGHVYTGTPSIKILCNPQTHQRSLPELQECAGLWSLVPRNSVVCQQFAGFSKGDSITRGVIKIFEDKKNQSVQWSKKWPRPCGPWIHLPPRCWVFLFWLVKGISDFDLNHLVSSCTENRQTHQPLWDQKTQTREFY